MVTAIEIGVCFSFFRTIVTTYLPVFARREVGLPDSVITSLGVSTGIAIFLIRLFLGNFIKNLKFKKMLLFMLSICVFMGLTIPFSRNSISLYMQMFALGICVGVLIPIGSILVANSTTQHERGFGNTLQSFTGSISRMSTILLASYIETQPLIFIFPIASILPFIAIIISSIIMKPISEEALS
jgi:MFS family permease